MQTEYMSLNNGGGGGSAEEAVIQTIVSLAVLLFSAKILSEVFHRINQPAVIGQLLAGIIAGPFALGGLLYFHGEPLVVVNETVKQFGEIAAIVILFIAGMEITPKEFFKKGAASFTVGSLSVIVPFFGGYIVFLYFFSFAQLEVLLIATALTATSIAISVRVLTEMNKMQSKEGRLILGAAIVDDVLAIAVLSVVTSMVDVGGVSGTTIFDIIFLILQTLGFFGALLIGAIILIPKLLKKRGLWKSEGSIEGITTASFFAAAGIAAIIGLSPIVGAFAVGMAVASTHLIKRVEEYTDKLGLIFAPLFFAIIGAQVDLRGVDLYILYIAGIMIAIAVVTKIAGTSLPAMIFLKDKSTSMKVGIGMISRGEVGLIVAQVGLSAGILSANVYTMVIIMAAATTIITPIWLKTLYKREKKTQEK